jgi:mycobactin peptide synthetase MbtE
MGRAALTVGQRRFWFAERLAEELLRARQAASCSWEESTPTRQEEPSVGRAALTVGQRRFWFAERLAPGSPAHVAVTRILLNGALDRPRLDRALNEVVTRHPALRTVFPRQGASPIPRLLTPGTLPVSWHSAGEISEEDLLASLAAQVHDLDGGPLIAVGGIQDGELRNRIVVCVHHIAYDLESERSFVRDLAHYYAGRSISPVKLPASIRAVSQQDRERLREFWKKHLKGAPVLHLPDSNPLPLRVVWTRKLVTARVDLSAADPVRLRSAAAELRVPVLAFFLTAWWRVLACHTDSTDHVIGTAVAATDGDSEYTIGYHANNIPVRVAMSAGQLAAIQQLSVVRDNLLDALDHAGLPTDEIALLAPRPPAGRMPIYQSMVLLQSVTPPYKVGHVEFVPQPGFPLGPQCELLLEIWEADDGFIANLLSPEGFLPLSRIERLASDVSVEMFKIMSEIAPE